METHLKPGTLEEKLPLVQILESLKKRLVAIKKNAKFQLKQDQRESHHGDVKTM